KRPSFRPFFRGGRHAPSRAPARAATHRGGKARDRRGMDSFEFNKLIGGLLATVFVVFSVTLVADSLFAAHSPEKPGYIIEAAEPAEGGVTAPGEEEEPIAVLLASADVGAGETAFRKCVACHTAENGGANKVGPNLWNIVNRPVASHEGFSYSSGMRAFAEGGTVWDYDH